MVLLCMAKVKLPNFLVTNCLFFWTALAMCPLLSEKFMGTFLNQGHALFQDKLLGDTNTERSTVLCISDDFLNSLKGLATNNKTFNKYRKLYQNSQFVKKSLS